MKNLLATQISALQKSVKKWENIVAVLEDPDYFVVFESGAEDCACCKEFIHVGQKGCEGCPIAEKVENISCGSTPYEEWVEAFDRLEIAVGSRPGVRFETKKERQSLLKPAKKELAFLRKLLEEKAGEGRTLVAQLQKVL